MLKPDQIKGQVLDHHGLVKATIDNLGLEKLIDNILPVCKEKGAILTMGERTSAMILNGLGFMDDRLYMFPEFLDNKPVERLFRPGIKANHFNDDSLGRCLDAISDYGPTKLFCELSFKIGQKFKLLGKTAHFDTTSLIVYGDYNQVEQEQTLKQEEKQEKAQEQGLGLSKQLIPTYGYSKEGRSDLKQVILLLGSTGAANLPIFMSSHSGNASDKITIPKAIERANTFASFLTLPSEFMYIGDSAMYENIIHQKDIYWATRVPHSLKQAKEVLSKDEASLKYEELENGYKVSQYLEVLYKEKAQKWIVVYSEQKHKREKETFYKKIESEQKQMSKKLWHLSNQIYNCKKDIHAIIKPLKKQLKHHRLDYQVEEIYTYPQSGRPKPGIEKELQGYKVVAKLERDQESIQENEKTLGKFILATNQFDKDKFSERELLKEYKNQQKVEKGFAFIKSDAFEVSSIFLKKPSRISALMMVMTLCLLVHNLATYFLHKELEEKEETLPNQLKKEVKNPSLCYIFRRFHGIQVIKIDFGEYKQELVSNIGEIHSRIIRYFGSRAEQIYGLVA